MTGDRTDDPTGGHPEPTRGPAEAARGSGDETGGPTEESRGTTDATRESADATVSVTVPDLLARFVGDRHTLTLRAGTLGAGVARLLEDYPALEPHVFDGTGHLRTHVRLYCNGSSVEWPDAASRPLQDGDELLVLQAVSGG